jgi:Cellulase (glycosyl hydrolase family 5)
VTKRDRKSTKIRAGMRALIATVCLLAAMGVGASPASALVKGFWGPAQVNGVSQFPIYRDLGVSLFQTAINWASVAHTRPANPRDPNDPAYQWPPDEDYAIEQASANHMHVLLMLTGSPSWANGGRGANYAPTRPSDFADFATAAAKRYPAIRHWMIWGEPTRVPNFKPFVAQSVKAHGRPLTTRQQQAPHRYARLLDTAYGALKAVSPKNLVIGGNTYTTGDIPPVAWVQNLKLANGKPPRMDLYGHNPFSYRHPSLKNNQSSTGTVDFSDLGRFQKVIDRSLARPRHKRIRLFLSEFTVPTDKPDAEFNFHVTRALQAKWITDAFRVARQVHAYGLGWIHLYDDPPDPTRAVVQTGLIDGTGNKKPGYFAFKRG